jgi:hypothetical protein
MQLFGEGLRSANTLPFQGGRELLDAGVPDRWPTRILLEHGEYAVAIQPLAEGSLESWPIRDQQCPQTVGQAVGVTTQIGIVSAQQLEVCSRFAARLEPHDAVGMRPGHVGKHEGILWISLALASVEVTCACHG